MPLTVVQFSTLRVKMVSKQESLRQRVVQFYNKNCDKKKSYTVNHFVDEGCNRESIYRIIRNYESRKTTTRKTGSGRKAKIMNKDNLKKLKRLFDHRDNISQRKGARKFGCTQQYISNALKKIGVKCYKKIKSPEYSPDQIKAVKKQCRWMYQNYAKKLFILDDEKYFSLSGNGNNFFYASDKQRTPNNVKHKFKRKFEAKVMLYIVVSSKGISKPFFRKSGLAVDQNTYVKSCLSKILVPFLRKYHSDGNYIFWSDKASSHYSKKAIQFLENENVHFVPKDKNPTNLPQCRPIEDFFGSLSNLVYENGWAAKNMEQLKRRIRFCLKKMDQSAVQKSFEGIKKKLRNVYEHGPFEVVH